MHLPITTLVTFLLVICSAAGSNLPAFRQASLDGTWKLETVEENGKAIELGDLHPRWVIKGNTIHYAGEKLVEVNLDSTSTPKSIDLVWVKPNRTFEGIYSVDQDTFKLCVNRETEGIKDRPQDFVTEGKTNLRLLTFKRENGANLDPMEGVGGFVGIMIGLSENEKQVIVVGTVKDSPAEKAGLLKDDSVLVVNNSPILELQPLVSMIRKQKPGQELTMRIRRGGQEKELAFKVGKLPFLYLE